MTYQNNKISELIEDQLPNFLQEDGPKFVKFVEKYYEWMETSKLEVSTTGTISLDFSLDVKIKGTKQIVGSEDVKHVYAEVLNSYDLGDGKYVFYIKEYSPDPNLLQTRGFSSGDTIDIISGDDGSTGVITASEYIQNSTLSSKNLWNLQDIDRTLDDYVDFFMKEYLEGFPLAFPSELQSTDIDVAEFKKFLVKHSREFYQSKGTEDSFKFFFKSIFNDTVTVSYPKDDILKPSDNTFSRTKTILLNPNLSTVPDIASQKIVGQTSGVEAYVENILGIKKGGYSLFEIELNEYGLNGSFIEGENIVLENDPSTVIGTINFGASSVIIHDVEESFELEKTFYIDRSGEIVEYQNIQNIDRGALTELRVCEINSGKITEIEATSSDGYDSNQNHVGYNVGDKITFDNTDCFLPTGPRKPIEAVVSEIQYHPPVPIVKNGTFTDSQDGIVPDDWTPINTGGADTIWKNIGVGGNPLAQLRSPDTGFGAQLYQHVTNTFTLGQTYKLKFKIRGWSGGSGDGLSVKDMTYGIWPKGETGFSASTAVARFSDDVNDVPGMVSGQADVELSFVANQDIIDQDGVTIYFSYGGRPYIYGYVNIDDVSITDSNDIELLASQEFTEIKKIQVLCDGKGYIKNPTVTKIGEKDVTTETFEFTGNDIGTLKSFHIRSSGVKYKREKIEHYLENWTSTPQSSLVLDKTQIGIELPYLTLTIQNQSGDFTVGEIVNHQTLDGTGKVVSWNSGTGELVLREYSGVFSSGDQDIIEGESSNETGTVGVASYDSTKFKVGNGEDVWGDLSYSSGVWNDNILNQPYTIELDLNSSGTDNVRLTFGSIFDDGGRFLNNNSFVSDVKYIQDSFYYQTYSYLLETSLEVRRYKDLLKRLIHPAGMRMFGKISTENVEDVKVSLAEIKTNISMVVWDYISKHSNTLIRDFDFLYSLLILDGDSSSQDPVEITADGSDSGLLIPDIYYHGSYASDYLYNENTHQNYRFKIKYKNLRPGTPEINDFYEWNKLTGTVSIPYDSYTITGVGTTFTSLNQGDIIAINGQQFSVASITDDLELIVNTCSEEEVLPTDGVQLIKRVLISD